MGKKYILAIEDGKTNINFSFTNVMFVQLNFTLSGFHPSASLARSGFFVCKSLNPISKVRPVQ